MSAPADPTSEAKGGAIDGLVSGVPESVYSSDRPSTTIWSARMAVGAAKPNVPASATSSSGSTVSTILRTTVYSVPAITPIAPTTLPFLYSGRPPGSAANPSGERLVPIVSSLLRGLASGQGGGVK